MTPNEEYWDRWGKIDATRTDRDIIEEMAVVDWVNPSQSTRRIIHDLISWNVMIALDPAVSRDALALYRKGYEDAKNGIVDPKYWEEL